MDVWQIGVCTECHSDQPAKYMEKTAFAQPPCKFCGGVVSVIAVPDDDDITAARRENAIIKADSQRGIYSKPADSDGEEHGGYELH